MRCWQKQDYGWRSLPPSPVLLTGEGAQRADEGTRATELHLNRQVKGKRPHFFQKGSVPIFSKEASSLLNTLFPPLKCFVFEDPFLEYGNI